jgi:hypothetical protein
MDINKFARKPQLTEITLDDEELVKAYGEPIKFWMYDFVDINTYFDFFRSQGDKNNGQLNAMLRLIILTEDGNPALSEGDSLPIDITIAALTKINELLGKSSPKPLTSDHGNQAK